MFYGWLNLLGMGYSLFMVVALAAVNVLETCPALYDDCDTCPALYDDCDVPIFNATIIVFQICANLFLIQYSMRINRVSYWTLNSASLLPRTSSPLQPHDDNSGRFCDECGINAPRRSHHCPLCRVCVLRCDHHCFMTGACIGIANQRYFVVFLFWVCIGAAYGITYMLAYMNRFIAPNSPYGYATYLAPFACIQWLIGNLTGFQVFMSVLLCIAISATTAAVAFLAAQMFYISRGYTMFDYHNYRTKHNLEGDGKNLSERLALVFGRNWLLNFVFPQFWNPNVLTAEIAQNIFRVTSKDV
uniref:Palmitoyltransferase n=1 Tax=Steinernema glaseri TaxID=37863 RepID=A0A1I7ZUN3_9BILA